MSAIEDNQVNGSKVFVKPFPGATVTQLEHYIMPHLLEQSPDSVVLHIGTNNIRPRFSSHEKSSLEIANNVIRGRTFGFTFLCS